MKNSFIIYTDYLEQTAMLSNEQMGILFRGILQYQATGEIIEMDDLTKLAFDFIRVSLDKDAQKYESVCEKRREAGKKGGEQKKKNLANASKCKQKVANVADNDNDNDSDSDNDNNIHTLAQKKAEQEQAFDDFWKLYPKKRSKAQAKKAWEKINPSKTTVRAIMDKLPRLINSQDWKKDGGQFIPYPATWLNAGGWEDEVGPPGPERNNRFNNFTNQSYDINSIESKIVEH